MVDKTESSLVSICIPTYNGSQFIAEALESAINQSYTHLEIIVSDDASSDSTLLIVKAYKAKTDIPIYVHHHKPISIGANWNNCIKQAKGEYIKFLFQDDVLLPHCVKDMVAVLEKDDTISLVTSKREFIFDPNYSFPNMDQWIDNFDDLQKNLDIKTENELGIIDSTLFKSKQFLRSPLNKIGEPSVFMFRKDVIHKIGYFREDLKQILDYEFCYRILKTSKIAIIDKVLVQFRLHELQATEINKKDKSELENEGYSKILYKDYLDYIDPYMRKHLIKKHHLLYRVYYAIKVRIKRLIT